MRSLACFLFAIAGCLSVTGVQAQRESIGSCLKGWDLPPLRLPYFPRYEAAGCTRPEPPPKESAPRYLSGSTQTLKLELRTDLTPMSAALQHPVDPNLATEAAFAHFDAWFKANGFQRTEATEPRRRSDDTPIPRSATYEATRHQGKVRVSLVWPGNEKLVIHLEKAGGLRADVAVRKPEADFRFQDPLAELFKLPGSELIVEEVLFRDQHPVPIDNKYLQDKYGPGNGGAGLFLPEKWLRYRYAKEVDPTEAQLALREALKQAGWTINPGTSGTSAYFDATGRRIALEVRFYFDAYIGFNVAQVVVRDPLYQERQAPIQASFEALGQYTFSLDPPAEESALRLAAASFYLGNLRSRMHPDSKYALQVTPVAANAAAAAKAKEMASKVRDELAQRGWEARRIDISPDAAAPGPETAGLAAGVRLAFYECGTRNMDRPGGAVPTCVCWRERAERVTKPGACPQ